MPACFTASVSEITSERGKGRVMTREERKKLKNMQERITINVFSSVTIMICKKHRYEKVNERSIKSEEAAISLLVVGAPCCLRHWEISGRRRFVPARLGAFSERRMHASALWLPPTGHSPLDSERDRFAKSLGKRSPLSS